MKLEQQVVNLELAKKLKELGFKQESLFWWVEKGQKYGDGYGNTAEDLTEQMLICSAPICGYLGEGERSNKKNSYQGEIKFKAIKVGEYGDARVSGNAWVYGKLSLTLGYFFGYKEKKADLKYFSLGDDSSYELIGKGNCKVEEENSQKTELLKKADELIAKAQELKDEANKL